MAIDPTAVGRTGEPRTRSWTSTDALLYAVGVGAGLGEPTSELPFTTENSDGVGQQVLPTYAVRVMPGLDWAIGRPDEVKRRLGIR